MIINNVVVEMVYLTDSALSKNEGMEKRQGARHFMMCFRVCSGTPLKNLMTVKNKYNTPIDHRNSQFGVGYEPSLDHLPAPLCQSSIPCPYFFVSFPHFSVPCAFQIVAKLNI